MWAGQRHLYLPLITSLAYIITSIVGRVLAVIDLKAVAGWAAATFVVWWTLMNPADAGHLASNVAVFMSTAKAGMGSLRRVGLINEQAEESSGTELLLL
jgi:hypothetical protein